MDEFINVVVRTSEDISYRDLYCFADQLRRSLLARLLKPKSYDCWNPLAGHDLRGLHGHMSKFEERWLIYPIAEIGAGKASIWVLKVPVQTDQTVIGALAHLFGYVNTPASLFTVYFQNKKIALLPVEAHVIESVRGMDMQIATRFSSFTPVALDRVPKSGVSVEDVLLKSLANVGVRGVKKLECLHGRSQWIDVACTARVGGYVLKRARFELAQPHRGLIFCGRLRFLGIGVFSPVEG